VPEPVWVEPAGAGGLKPPLCWSAGIRRATRNGASALKSVQDLVLEPASLLTPAQTADNQGGTGARLVPSISVSGSSKPAAWRAKPAAGSTAAVYDTLPRR